MFLASGCATNGVGGTDKPISPEQRVAIRSVSIAQNVSAPDYPRVFGPSARTAFFIFGALSAIETTDRSQDPDAQAYRRFLRAHGIDVGDIVRREFQAQLPRMRAFPEIVPEGGDARLELTIEDYGLGTAPTLRPFHFPLRPTLRLTAKLVNHAGEALWQKSAYITAINESIASSTYDEVLADPAWTQQGFKIAARMVTMEILQDLGAHPMSLATSAMSLPQPRPVPSEWIAIENPAELRAIYSNTTFHGSAFTGDAAQGRPFVGEFRSDGTGTLLIEGRRIPRTWEVKGNDQVCATDATGTNCYRLARSTTNPREFLGRHVSSGVTMRFTVEGYVPPATASRPVASIPSTSEPSNLPTDSTLPPAGSQWVYGFIDRQYGRRQIYVAVRVMRVNGSLIDESVAFSGSNNVETQRSVSAGEARFLTHRFANGAELTEFAPYFLAANGERASAMAITATGYPVGSSSLPGFTSTAQIQGWEQVTVPAGTFRALRVEMAGNRGLDFFTRDAVAGRFKLTVWYAPEVRRFVRLEHMTWSAYRDAPAQLNHDVVELLSFRPPS